MRRDPFQRSAIHGVPVFDALPRRVRRTLATHADRLRLPAGAVLADQGSVAREFVYVVDGQVVERRGDAPSGLAGPGTGIGAAAVVSHGVHPTSWVAVTEVDVVVIDAPAYRWAAKEVGPITLAAWTRGAASSETTPATSPLSSRLSPAASS